MNITVVLPGGQKKPGVFVGPAAASSCFIQLPGTPPLVYTFSLKNGKGRGRLKHWKIQDSDLNEIRLTIEKERLK